MNSYKNYVKRKKIFTVLICIQMAFLTVTNVKKLYPILLVDAKDGIQAQASKEYVQSVEDIVDENLVNRMNYIEWYAYAQNLMGKNEYNNFSMIKDKLGYLQYANFYKEDDQNIEEYALRLKRMKEQLDKVGTKLLVVLPPSKFTRGITPMPYGLPANDPNPTMDTFLYYVNRLGIDTLDYRDYFPKTVEEYKETFFKTDHHWTIPTCFKAYQILVDEMNKRYNANLDPTGKYRDINEYNYYHTEKSFLGSMGRKTSVGFVPMEDYDFLLPKDEGNYDVTSTSDFENTHETGPFTQSVMTMKYLKDATSTYEQRYYDIYLGGLPNYQQIVNLNNPDGPSVFVIRDSYYGPVSAFFSQLCSRMDLIYNLRESDTYNAEKLLKQNHYDYVIYEVYPYNIMESAFQFYK